MPAILTPTRFFHAKQAGIKRVDGFARAREKMLREFVGDYYGECPSDPTRPLALFHTGCRMMMSRAVARCPQFAVTSTASMYPGPAMMLQMAMNWLAGRMNLRKTFRKVFIDHLVGCGITKCGRSGIGGAPKIRGWRHATGQPFCEPVALGNFIADPFCRDFEESLFLGDEVAVPLDWLRGSGLYNTKGLDKLDDWLRRREGLTSGSFVEDLSSRGLSMDERMAVRMVGIQEFWFPQDNLLVTVPAGVAPGPLDDDWFLRVEEFDGTETGPYDFFMGMPVPENPFPVATASTWLALATKTEEVASRIVDQSTKFKRVNLFPLGQTDEADLVRDADDDEWIGVADPRLYQAIDVGGPQEAMAEALMMLEEKFNRASGNMDQQSGRRDRSNTATAAAILDQHASEILDDVRDEAYEHAMRVGQKLAYYLWTDPLIELPMVRRRGDVQIPLVFSPEARDGELFDYAINVKPRSMERSLRPEVRTQRLLAWIKDVLMPSVQMSMGTMGTFKANAVMRLTAADFGIEDEADEIWQDEAWAQRAAMLQQMIPPPGQGQPAPGGGGGGGGSAYGVTLQTPGAGAGRGGAGGEADGGGALEGRSTGAKAGAWAQTAKPA